MAAKGLKQQLADKLAVMRDAVEDPESTISNDANHAQVVSALALAVVAEQLAEMNQHLQTLALIAADAKART